MSKKSSVRHLLLPCGISFALTLGLLVLIGLAAGIAPFGSNSLLYSDARIQYYDFFMYYRDLLTGQNSVSYTLSNWLGGDTFGLLTYYLASPFNLLILLFDRNDIGAFFSLAAALKLSTAALTMAIFLRMRFSDPLKNLWVVLLSVSYGLMQYNIAQSSNLMWLDGVYLLPLVLLGVHRAVWDRKTILLTVSVALMIIFNWYAAGIGCVFSIFWFFFELADRFLCTQPLQRQAWRPALGALLRYGFSMALGVALSSFFFLPTVLNLLSGKGPNVMPADPYLGNLLSAVQNYHIGAVGAKGVPALFCGSVALIGCIGVFFLPKISRRHKLLYGALLLLCLMIHYDQPLFNLFSLFNQAKSYWYRYSFVAVFGLLYLAACCFQAAEAADAKKLAAIGAGFAAVLLTLEYLNPQEEELHILYRACLLTLATGAALAAVLAHRRRAAALVLAGLLMLELSYNGIHLYKDDYRGEDAAGRVVYSRQLQRSVEAIKAQEPEPFRMSQTFYHARAAFSEAFSGNYWSNTSYTSCPQKTQLDFLQRLGYRTEADCITVVYTSILPTDSLLGVRYVLSSFPIKGLVPRPDLPGSNGKDVYENPYSLPMAFLTEEDVTAPVEFHNPFDYLNALYSRLMGEPTAVFQPLPFSKTEQDGVLSYEIQELNPDFPMYGNLPFTYASKAKVSVNGQPGFHYQDWMAPSVFYLPENPDSQVTTLRVTSSKYKLTQPEQFYMADLDVLQAVHDRIRAEAVDGVPFGGAEMEFTVSASGGQSLVLSLPAAKGWQIQVNGAAAEPGLLGDCLMVLPLEAGENSVRMHYEIPGLKAGIAVSAAAALCLAGLILLHFKKKKA